MAIALKLATKAIFSINTGRSGSAYLATILSEARNTASFHEPAPTGFGAALQAFNTGDSRPMTDVARSKVKSIRKANDKGLIYVETNHCFIKGFGWPLMEMVDPASIGIIVLRRDPEKIAESMMRILSLPLNHIGQKYNLTPERKDPGVRPPAFFMIPGATGYRIARKIFRGVGRVSFLGNSAKKQNDSSVLFRRYQRAVIDWYIKETDYLETEFRRKHSECKYYETDLEGLNDPAEMQRLCDFFGIEIDAANADLLGKPVNLKN